MKIRYKILLASTWGAVATGIVCVAVSRSTLRTQGIEQTRNAMRTALIGAESVRDSFSAMGETGVLQKEHLLSDFRAIKTAGGDVTGTALYQTIPIIAGWRALDTVSRQQGFSLRVAKENARNPKNVPTAEDTRILAALERQKGDEYFEVNEALGEMFYARPIILTKDCLSCHGDPAKSASGDGKDIFGQKMEGWKVGEAHGAFILKQSTREIDRFVKESTQTMLLVVALVGVISLGVSLWIVAHVLRGFAAIEATLSER